MQLINLKYDFRGEPTSKILPLHQYMLKERDLCVCNPWLHWGGEWKSWKWFLWYSDSSMESVSPNILLPHEFCCSGVECARLGSVMAFAEGWSLGGSTTWSGDLILQFDSDIWHWLVWPPGFHIVAMTCFNFLNQL